MATAAALNQARGPSMGFIERAVMFMDRASGSRLTQLLSTTSLTRSQPSPFGDFGAVVAAGSKALPVANTLRDVAVFTIEEARERISSFVGGKFVPNSVSDLMSYLGDRFLKIETRVMPQGRAANYLVDTKTNRSVPAAQVDPRLGHRAMLLNDLRGSMRRHYGTGEPASSFHSWQGMQFVLDNDNSGIGYTVSRGQGYVGKVHGIASVNVEENLSLIRAARAKGIDLVLPEAAPGGGLRGALIPGMPILVKTRSLKAEDVHPQLGHDKLSIEWGMGMDTAFRQMAERDRRNGDLSFTGNVVSIETFRAKDDFKKRFVRRRAEAEEVDAPSNDDIGFGGAASSGKRDIVVRFPEHGSDPYVYDRDIAEEVAVSVNSLPPGRYPLESETGVRLGNTDVGNGGAVRHVDLEGNRIRPESKPEAEPDRPARSMGR